MLLCYTYHMYRYDRTASSKLDPKVLKQIKKLTEANNHN